MRDSRDPERTSCLNRTQEAGGSNPLASSIEQNPRCNVGFQQPFEPGPKLRSDQGETA